MKQKPKEKFSSRFDRSEYEEKRWQGEKSRSLRIAEYVERSIHFVEMILARSDLFSLLL